MMNAGLDVLKDVYRNCPDLQRADNPEFSNALKAAGVDVEKLIQESKTAPRVTSEQIMQKLDLAFGKPQAMQVRETRAEFRASNEAVNRARQCCPCGTRARGQCYRQYGCGRGRSCYCRSCR